MAKATRLDGWGGIFKAWFFTIFIQGVVMYILSYLFIKCVLTEDHFLGITTMPGFSPAGAPQYENAISGLRGFLLTIAQNNKIIINSVLMIFGFPFYFKWGKPCKEITAWMILFIVIFLCMVGVTWSSAGWWAWAYLTGCAPLWAFLSSHYSIGSSGDNNDLTSIKYQTHGEFERGVKLVQYNNNSQAFARLTEKETPKDGKAGIQIVPDEPFPFARENQHYLALGSPGSGKTQIIFPMKIQAIKRGDKVISWDVKGTDTQALAGEPGVDLLAAWDKRSIEWAPGADVTSVLDCKDMADIFMPPNPKDAQPFFLNSARQILEAIFTYLRSNGKDWGWGDVWDILSKDRKELALLLSSFKEGKIAAGYISGDGKSGDDVYSTLMTQVQQNIRWFAMAWPKRGVSLRNWIRSDSKLLIIGGTPQRADLARATANIVIEIIINEILSLPDDPNRRIWLFLDELATLGKLDVLLNAFSLGRSKGLCVVAGIQDIGKIEHIYGHNLAKSITNTFSTMVVLRCSDVETSQWASSVLGEQDIIETQRSSGSSSKGWGEDTVTSTHEQKVHRTRKLFTASEIAHFPNLDGVMRVSGWPLLDLRWPYRPIPQSKPVVVDADWL
jgi:hypothetical protein